jgi:hypothetical protein
MSFLYSTLRIWLSPGDWGGSLGCLGLMVPVDGPVNNVSQGLFVSGTNGAQGLFVSGTEGPQGLVVVLVPPVLMGLMDC